MQYVFFLQREYVIVSNNVCKGEQQSHKMLQNVSKRTHRIQVCYGQTKIRIENKYFIFRLYLIYLVMRSHWGLASD